MDIVFGYNKKKPVMNSTWEWLQEYDDRFTEAYTISGDEEIEGLRKIDAIEMVENIVSQGIEQDYIGYWDRDNEKIWILSPVKMALLLHKYDESNELLNRGYTLEKGFFNECVYAAKDFDVEEYYALGLEFPPEYDKQNPSSAKGIKIWKAMPIITGLEMVFADENMPLDLAVKLLDDYIITVELSCIYDAINQNVVTKKLNPKWIMKLCENSNKKQEMLKALALYAFSRCPAFMTDNSNTFNSLGRISWEQHMYGYMMRLQLQLDIAKIMLENKKTEKLKRAIIRDCIFSRNTFEISYYNMNAQKCNEKYTLDQINCLIKQRKKLIELCENNKGLIRTMCLKMLSEAVIFRTNLIDYNAFNYHIDESKCKDISNAIDKYEEMAESYFSKKWTDRELQSGLQGILKEVSSLEGLEMVDAVCNLSKGDIEFSLNKEMMAVINKWLSYISLFAIRQKTPMIDPQGFATYEIDDEALEKHDAHKDIVRISKTLSKIKWIVKEPWIPSTDISFNEHFYMKLAGIDDETVYGTFNKTGLLTCEGIKEIIAKLIENGNFENIPYLIALKSIK